MPVKVKVVTMEELLRLPPSIEEYLDKIEVLLDKALKLVESPSITNFNTAMELAKAWYRIDLYKERIAKLESQLDELKK